MPGVLQELNRIDRMAGPLVLRRLFANVAPEIPVLFEQRGAAIFGIDAAPLFRREVVVILLVDGEANRLRVQVGITDRRRRRDWFRRQAEIVHQDAGQTEIENAAIGLRDKTAAGDGDDRALNGHVSGELEPVRVLAPVGDARLAGKDPAVVERETDVRFERCRVEIEITHVACASTTPPPNRSANSSAERTSMGTPV